MNIAQGSLEECRYYIILSRDLSYINQQEYDCLNVKLEEISRLLNQYIKGLVEKRFND
jgi:four helix bundle protein